MKVFALILSVIVLAIGILTWVFQHGLKRFDDDVALQEVTPVTSFPVNLKKGDGRFQRAPRPKVVEVPAATVEEAPEVVVPEVVVPGVVEMITLPEGSVSADHTVKLTTEIPEAMFEGTKVPIKLANLEPVEIRQRPLPVPPGLRNLAQEKEVTASDDLPVIGDLEYVTDGDKDAADGSYVELGPQVQWVQIDLESPQELHAVWVWHFHKSARAYIDVVVQVSNDANFASGEEVTIYNADHDNSSGLGTGRDKAYVETNRGRVMRAGGTVARYVRLYSNGNSSNEMNHYIEVEVWGRSRSEAALTNNL